MSVNKATLPVSLCVAMLLGACGQSQAPQAHAVQYSPVDEVALFAGTDAGAPDFGHGGGAANVFPGAVGGPFGMVQFSPDTLPHRVNYVSAYTHSDSTLRGFSLKHLSGSGCPYYGDLPITPTTEAMTGSPVKALSEDMEERFVPSFSHEHESASPGDYRVVLDPGTAQAIEAELTATLRSAIARFTFPQGSTGTVLLNAGGSLMANNDAKVMIDPIRREVSGSSASGGFCYYRSRYRIFYVAQFDRPFAAFGTWRNQTLSPGATEANDTAFIPAPILGNYFPIPGLPPSLPTNPSMTAQAGAYVSFDASERRDVQVRVGVSFVSVEKARANLLAETEGRTFERLRSDARSRWDQALGRFEISGGSVRDRRLFYTSAYRTMIAPSIFSDADGEYIGFDGNVHRADGWTKYADFSTWDMSRTHWPWLAMTEPERVADMTRSLLADAAQSGWLPKWAIANDHTNIMVGDSGALLMAQALAMGVNGVDGAAALAAMLKGANQPGSDADGYTERPALALYQALGYVPHEVNGDVVTTTLLASAAGITDLPWGTASTTLEYAYDDFAVARSAALLGDTRACESLALRSANWRKLFNPATGYVQARSLSGLFVGSGGADATGFVEGNSAQWTWYVPHDPAGLFVSMGGQDQALLRLRDFFTELNAGPALPYAYYGNQPSHLVHALFHWLGEPAETSAVARRITTELIQPEPKGYPGNEDLGSLSSLILFSASGLFPGPAGTDVVLLTAPLFPRLTIRRSLGDLVIEGRDSAPDTNYVGTLTLNSRLHRQAWLHWRDLAGGGHLEFELSRSPTDWGRGADALPPSFPPGLICAPDVSGRRSSSASPPSPS